MNLLRKLKNPLLSSFLPASVIVITLRLLGWLEPFELLAYDWFFQIRPPEPIDERIVIVGLEEKELKQLYPITDRTLAQLLLKIKEQQPNVIGLDLFRDISVGEGAKELEQVIKSMPNLYGGKKVIGPDQIAAHPTLEELAQVATGDQIHDSDGFIRRSLLQAENFYENTVYSIGTTLAFLYLQDKNIFPEKTSDGLGIQLGKIRFYRLKENDGGYHQAQSGGYQILVNFRNPQKSFKKVSFSEVFLGKIEKDLFKDKIVVIGTAAVSIKDQFFIPYSRTFNGIPQPIYGVEYVAQEASNIVSAVLDQRPIIKLLPYPWLEALAKYSFILSWGLLLSVLLWKFKKSKTYFDWLLFLLLPIIISASLFGISFLAFLTGWWLPLIPSLLEILLVAVLSTVLILTEKVTEYQKILRDLESAQNKILAGQKQKALSELVTGVAHEINNPLNFVENYAEFSNEWLESLLQDINNLKNNQSLEEEFLKIFEVKLDNIKENLQEITNYSRRASSITKILLQQSYSKEARPTFTDINKLISSILEISCYSNSKNADCSINHQTDLDSTIGEQKVVAEDLGQILINLINNACDAVIEKKVNTTNFIPTVFVESSLEEEKVKIEIKDNGDGILPKAMDSIFNPFYTTKQEGTGLGLYLSQQLLQKNGGSIRWHREEGWTIFTINWPVTQ
ncbi:integral membrane sensor signal transduction histidine kinase [Aphanothece hegewaldii CCALA 016]|uniref:histidine kinase n=1 Tax=Aphanothece hegewaldii CCALA 016 TaxID=2107694 RepID=A0A2T1LVY3_9CHRO|nr:CHASE2 domain-containing protein [Aphanothece hegewaldii]PSF35785.1 integral membrane sensor signal transduction histidine kinase [Aphanothece hegewaldii CCALA 016]